jgi:hypothetical protein
MVICQDYLLYIPSEEDENSSSIHIVDLSSDDKNVILIDNVVGNFDSTNLFISNLPLV